MHHKIRSENRRNDEMPNILDRYRKLIEVHLPQDIPEDGAEIYHMLRYCMGWSDQYGNPTNKTVGKLLRPSLCLFTCESVSSSVDKALPAAVTLELIHNFSLIHDEIQDFDEKRHHRPTLWTLWGIPRSLVAGDVLKIIAESSLERMLHIESAESSIKCLSLVTEACLEMIEGQYLDMSFEQTEFVSTAEYLDMISRKTGALIQSSMQLGALVATEDQKTAELFGECGRLLGLAFQVRDDYLGVWGDPNVFGKPVGSDIKRRKKALPAVYALQEVYGQDLNTLRSIYASSVVGDDEVQTVMDIMETVGTATYVQETASTYAYEALEPLSELDLSPTDFSLVQNIAEFFAKRSR